MQKYRDAFKRIVEPKQDLGKLKELAFEQATQRASNFGFKYKKKVNVTESREMSNKLEQKIQHFSDQTSIWVDRNSLIAAPLAADVYLNCDRVSVALGAPRFFYNDSKQSRTVPDAHSRFPYSDDAHAAAKKIQLMLLRNFMRRQDAARIIQNTYQSHAVRLWYKKTSQKRLEAVKIIRRFCGSRLPRWKRWLEKKKRKLIEIIKIQSLVRQFIVRKKIPLLLEVHRENLKEKARVKVQGICRIERRQRGIQRRLGIAVTRIQRVIRGRQTRSRIRKMHSSQLLIRWAFKKYIRRYYGTRALRIWKFYLYSRVRFHVRHIQRIVRGFLGRMRAERQRLKLVAIERKRTYTEQFALAGCIRKFAGESFEWYGDPVRAAAITGESGAKLGGKPGTKTSAPSSVSKVADKLDMQIAQLSFMCSQIIRGKLTSKHQKDGIDLNRKQRVTLAILSAFSNRPDGHLDFAALEACKNYLRPGMHPFVGANAINDKEVKVGPFTTFKLDLDPTKVATNLRSKGESRPEGKGSKNQSKPKVIDPPTPSKKPPPPPPPSRPASPGESIAHLRPASPGESIAHLRPGSPFLNASPVSSRPGSPQSLSQISGRVTPQFITRPGSSDPEPPKFLVKEKARSKMELRYLSVKPPAGSRASSPHWPETISEVWTLDEPTSPSKSSPPKVVAMSTKREIKSGVNVHVRLGKLKSLGEYDDTGSVEEGSISSVEGDPKAEEERLPSPRSFKPSEAYLEARRAIEKRLQAKRQVDTKEMLWQSLLVTVQSTAYDLAVYGILEPASKSLFFRALLLGTLPQELILHAVLVRRWTKQLRKVCINTIYDCRDDKLPLRWCKLCLEPFLYPYQHKACANENCARNRGLTWITRSSYKPALAVLHGLCKDLNKHPVLSSPAPKFVPPVIKLRGALFDRRGLPTNLSVSSSYDCAETIKFLDAGIDFREDEMEKYLDPKRVAALAVKATALLKKQEDMKKKRERMKAEREKAAVAKMKQTEVAKRKAAAAAASKSKLKPKPSSPQRSTSPASSKGRSVASSKSSVKAPPVTPTGKSSAAKPVAAAGPAETSSSKQSQSKPRVK